MEADRTLLVASSNIFAVLLSSAMEPRYDYIKEG